jgi:hypothetical protein
MLSMAQKGDIEQLHNQLAELDNSGQTFKTFVDRLLPLVKKFRILEIEELLEKYLKSVKNSC